MANSSELHPGGRPLIPRAQVTTWRAGAPWPSDAQIEQDLILSRAIVEIFNQPAVAQALAFRGGSALHKLFLTQAGRYSEDIDEYTLALLYLVTFKRDEDIGVRAWKGFDWETMNRLYDQGYISDPKGKTKSVGMTEEWFLKAKELFELHFTKI